MADPRSLLGFPGGRVLDVATGRGGFVQFLLEGLTSHDEIVGIDADAEARPPYEAAFIGRPEVRFELMDATALAFGDGAFDTVAIGSSLHHFMEPSVVLGEMRRVCRVGGRIVVLEMYRDGQGEPQLSHAQLHAWCAAIDTLGGKVHRETFTRAEVLALINGPGLADLRIHEVADTETDPMSPDTLTELEPAIERYLVLAEGRPDLRARGEELRRRIHEVGFLVATSVLAVGRV